MPSRLLARLRSTLHDQAEAERGSATLFWVIAAGLFLSVLALVVDGGGQLEASAHADDVANAAARAGGQQIDAGQAIPGGKIVVDPDAATSVARSFLQQAGVEGNVTVEGGGRRLVVTVHDTYHCLMLAALGRPTLSITGHGSAQLVEKVGG
ncbi:membrane protein [Streptomyces sp. NBRC 13847]|uniref:TadE/TadG family type IV pilus assembly protein n=1 Tax=Streptomyces TaxID=1883 RepID=UPI0024A12B5B|nr:pilus assembly protein TadG-related protein [Streptomyces sp. NBRC 13847]GLW19720.1 membrane protein [Streptomyces sp. NBRC 13847]